MTAPTFAELYERVLVPSIFLPWANDFLDRIRPLPNQRILDLACGTGIVARLARDRCGPGARIAGVDVNPEMIAVARTIAPALEWHVANALALPFPPRAFDLVICQQALQFFPDRAAAVGDVHRVLDSGGRFALSTWRPLEENPLFFALHNLAAARFGPHMDRRFSLGNDETIRSLLVHAGFHDVRSETVTRLERASDAKRFVAMNLDATVLILDEMSDAQRGRAIDQFQADAAAILAPFADQSGLLHPVSANVVMATA